MSSSSHVLALVGKLRNPDWEIRFKALKNVVMLAKNVKVRTNLVKAGAIKAIVQQAADTRVHVSRQACFALANLSLTEHYKVAIVSDEGFENVVGLIHPNNEVEIYEAVVFLLYNLTTYSQSAEMMVDMGISKKTAILLESRTDLDIKTQIKLVGMLTNMCAVEPKEVSDESLKLMIQRMQPVEERIIETKGKNRLILLRKLILLFFANVAHATVKDDAVALLDAVNIYITSPYQEENSLESALICIANLSSHQEIQVTVYESDAYANALKFLDPESRVPLRFQSYVILTLANLSSHSQICAYLGNGSTVKDCCVILEGMELSEEGSMNDVVTMISVILVNVSASSDDLQHFISHFDMLLSLLQVSNEQIRSYGVSILSNMCRAGFKEEDSNLIYFLLKSGNLDKFTLLILRTMRHLNDASSVSKAFFILSSTLEILKNDKFRGHMEATLASVGKNESIADVIAAAIFRFGDSSDVDSYALNVLYQLMRKMGRAEDCERFLSDDIFTILAVHSLSAKKYKEQDPEDPGSAEFSYEILRVIMKKRIVNRAMRILDALEEARSDSEAFEAIKKQWDEDYTLCRIKYAEERGKGYGMDTREATRDVEENPRILEQRKFSITILTFEGRTFHNPEAYVEYLVDLVMEDKKPRSNRAYSALLEFSSERRLYREVVKYYINRAKKRALLKEHSRQAQPQGDGKQPIAISNKESIATADVSRKGGAGAGELEPGSPLKGQKEKLEEGKAPMSKMRDLPPPPPLLNAPVPELKKPGECYFEDRAIKKKPPKPYHVRTSSLLGKVMKHMMERRTAFDDVEGSSSEEESEITEDEWAGNQI